MGSIVPDLPVVEQRSYYWAPMSTPILDEDGDLADCILDYACVQSDGNNYQSREFNGLNPVNANGYDLDERLCTGNMLPAIRVMQSQLVAIWWSFAGRDYANNVSSDLGLTGGGEWSIPDDSGVA